LGLPQQPLLGVGGAKKGAYNPERRAAASTPGVPSPYPEVQPGCTGCRVHPGYTKVIATRIKQDVEYSRGAEQQTRRALVVRYYSREALDSIYLCCCIRRPLATCSRTESPSTAKTSDLARCGQHRGSIIDYGLFFTPGLHRLGGFGRSRQRWRRPNDTQSATPNCVSLGQRTS
jgi:hypothetical protein